MKKKKPRRIKQLTYPVINTLPNGRRQVGVDSKGRSAPDTERSSGWICHPLDLPKHKGRARDRKKPSIPIEIVVMPEWRKPLIYVPTTGHSWIKNGHSK